VAVRLHALTRDRSPRKGKEAPWLGRSSSLVRVGSRREGSTISRGAFERWPSSLRTNEPRFIAFEAYLNDDGTEVTGVQIHPDADSMASHMQVAFERIMEFDQYLDTQSVEVYGVPNDAVLGMMKQIGDRFESEMSLRVRTNPVGGFTRAG
jgi:hypothetical protein